MSSRPVLALPLTPLELALELASGTGLLWTVGLVLFSYTSLPSSVPTHFGLGGEPDGWGPPWTMFILPAIGLVLYLLLTMMGRNPHRLNYPWAVTEANAPRQYRLVRVFLGLLKMEVILFFGYVKFTAIRVAMGNAPGLGPVFLPLFVSATLGTILAYIILAYRAR